MAGGAFVACKIDKRAISKRIKQHIDMVNAHIIRLFQYIGEYCVKVARESGSYNDITGNLRSSIGYVILQDGKPIVQGESQKFKEGDEGVNAAQSFLDKIRGEFPTGIVLIVYAGMKYAAYVENIHHKDVLASAELAAKSLAEQLLKELID